ncbi:MAG: hypothetical protein ACP5I3_11230 [Thermoproteus sp.]
MSASSSSRRLPRCPDLDCRPIALTMGGNRAICLGINKVGAEEYALCMFNGGELLKLRLNKIDVVLLREMLSRTK